MALKIQPKSRSASEDIDPYELKESMDEPNVKQQHCCEKCTELVLTTLMNSLGYVDNAIHCLCRRSETRNIQVLTKNCLNSLQQEKETSHALILAKWIADAYVAYGIDLSCAPATMRDLHSLETEERRLKELLLNELDKLTPHSEEAKQIATNYRLELNSKKNL